MISTETWLVILTAAIPVLTAVGSVITATVTASHSASKDQVKQLKEWVDTVDQRLTKEIEANKKMKAKLDEIQMERDQSQEEARRLSEQVSALSVQLQDKKNEVAAQDKKIREQDKRIREQDKRIQEQDQQMATMARTIERLELEVKLLGGGCGC